MISCGDLVGRRQVFGVLQALVAEPEDVQVGLVPLGQFVVGEPPEPLGLLPLRPVVGRGSRTRNRPGAPGSAGWSSA